MDGRNDTAVEALLEHLIEHGPGDSLTIRIFQLSALVGRAAPKAVTLTF